jgi:hypothetical protein
MDALDFAEQYKRVQVVVRQDQLLQLRKLSEFVQVGVVNYQIESHVSQVHFLDDVIKL